MARDRVDGLDVAAEPFRRPRVEQRHASRLVGGERRQRPRIQVVVRHRHVTGSRFHPTALEITRPRRQSAVEDAHVGDARRGQHPPRARRPGPVPVVVHHDRHALTHAPPPGRRLDVASGRQRVTSASRDGVIAEFVLERHVRRSRNMASLVCRAAVGFGQLPANVQDRHRIAVSKSLRQFCRGDQDLLSTHPSMVPRHVAGGRSKLTRVVDHAFSPAERRAVYRVIAERRDMRRFVPGAEIPDEVLARLLSAAHAAPSVGLMQPWRFIRITDQRLRREYPRPGRRGAAAHGGRAGPAQRRVPGAQGRGDPRVRRAAGGCAR